MSTNPFEAPTAENAAVSHGPQPFPTTVLVICILCLILGLLALLGVCINGVMLAASDTIANTMPGEQGKVYREAMEGQFVPMLISIVVGFILAPLMTVACIGCFTRKPWGRSLLVVSAICFLIWNVVTIAFSIWMMIFNIDALAAPNVPAMGEQGAIQLAYAGQVFAIVFSLAFAAFYCFVAYYMKRKNVVEFYEGTGVANVAR